MIPWRVSAVSPDERQGTDVVVEARTEAAALRKGRAALGAECKGWTFSAREDKPAKVGF